MLGKGFTNNCLRNVWAPHRACKVLRYASTTSSNDPQSAAVVVAKKGQALNVLLNRPKALNALNAEMVQILTPHYEALHKSKEPVVVTMKGAGGKAFCAGGDIRAIYDEVVLGTQGNLKESFFRDEYKLNYLIATLPQPHVALLNGITMGGGVGLSVHGRYRVATDNTVFAMPETAIGFFCDVGGSYFLPRLPGALGMYLGLTGARLEGPSVHEAGIATHFVPANKLEELENQLSQLVAPDDKAVSQILQAFHVVRKGTIQNHDIIDCIFGKATLDEIIFALELESQTNEWAKGVLHIFSKMSPTSLRVVFLMMQEGKRLPLDKCLQMEYNVSQAFMKHKESDFFEGVRALLVDKDKKPKWKPSALVQVKDQAVEEMYLKFIPQSTLNFK